MCISMPVCVCVCVCVCVQTREPLTEVQVHSGKGYGCHFSTTCYLFGERFLRRCLASREMCCHMDLAWTCYIFAGLFILIFGSKGLIKFVKVIEPSNCSSSLM